MQSSLNEMHIDANWIELMGKNTADVPIIQNQINSNLYSLPFKRFVSLTLLFLFYLFEINADWLNLFYHSHK